MAVIAWNGFFVACYVLNTFAECAFSFTNILFFFHVLHSIIYVKLGELQVTGCCFRLFSPVLVIVYDVLPRLMYGQVRQP